MLRADLDAPRKQRHTLKRIFDRLVAEYEMEGVSYSTVGDYVRWRRPEIRVEEGRGAGAGVHPAGAPAGRGGRGRLRRRVDHAGGRAHEVLPVHVPPVVFREVGAPASPCPAARRRSSRAMRTRSACWAASRAARSAMTTCARRSRGCWASAGPGWRPTGGRRSAPISGWTRSTAMPGIEGAHEKGGVEGEVGRFRRNRLVPVPEVGSLAELNAMIDAWDADDDGRRISVPRPHGRARTSPPSAAAEAAAGVSRSRPAGCSPRGWTGIPRSRCG